MDSFWFGIFSSLNFSEIMDNAFWNSFHGPSFLLGNLIRSVLWSGIGYIVFVRENPASWYATLDWLKHFFKRKQPETAVVPRMDTKKRLWSLLGQFIVVLFCLILPIWSVIVNVGNYTRMMDQGTIKRTRQATALVVGTAKGGTKSSYGRLVLLVDRSHFVNISNANKRLVREIEERDEKEMKVKISLNEQGKIVQVDFPATKD